MAITYLDEVTREQIANQLANKSESAPTAAGASGAPPISSTKATISNTLFSAAESIVHEYLSVQQYAQFLKSRQFHEVEPEYIRAVVEKQQHAERAATLEAHNAALRERRASLDDVHDGSNASQGKKNKAGEGERKMTSAELKEKMVKMWEHVTLELILADPLAIARFKQFCLRTACAENLFFWLACEEYRYIPSQAYLRVIASKIYSTHIVKSSRMEVNLPGHINRAIESALAHPTKKLFHDAQEVIFRLMNTGPFTMFLGSPEYRAYFEDLEKSAETTSKWSLSKLFSSQPAPILPPVGTTIAAVPSRTSSRGMSLSYADGKGGQRTSLFVGSSASVTESKPRLGRPLSAPGYGQQRGPSSRSPSPSMNRVEERPPLPTIANS